MKARFLTRLIFGGGQTLQALTGIAIARTWLDTPAWNDNATWSDML